MARKAIWRLGLVAAVVVAGQLVAPTATANGADTTGQGVIAWGFNDKGQTAVPAAALSDVAQVSAGGYHTLALSFDGHVMAWGDNAARQATVPAFARSGVSQIAAGFDHNLVLKAGQVLSWGGQTVVPEEAQTGVEQIAAGVSHSLALKNGGVISWSSDIDYPVPDAATAGVLQVAAGGYERAAVKVDGSVIVWDDAGNLQAVPEAAKSGVVQVSLSGGHYLALKSDGSVIAWGGNSYGQATVPVAAQSDVTEVAAGGYHSLALKADGSVVAWGLGESGQATVPPAAGAAVVHVAGGGYHSVAIKDRAAMRFVTSSRVVPESVGTAQVRIIRSGKTDAAAFFALRAAGTAQKGTDFTVVEADLSLGPGETEMTIPVTIRDDGAREGPETVVVSLTAIGTETVVLGSPLVLTIGASDQRPDALVSTRKSGGYVGNNVYNTTGAGQTRTVKARRGTSRTLFVRVVNDGNVANTLIVRGSATGAGSRVHYLVGSRDVTRRMRSPAGWSVVLAPGQSQRIAVKVTVKPGARVGSLKVARVSGSWTGDATYVDLVRAQVKVRR